jgi:hypothetical protein
LTRKASPVSARTVRIRRPILQLATADAVYLFRLNGGPLAEEIIHVLSDPDKVKAVVAVWDDIKGLQGGRL